MSESGWDPNTWGDEREQRVIFEGMTVAYRCTMYFLMVMLLVMYAAGQYVFGFVTLIGGLLVMTLTLSIYTRRHGVRMNEARFRKMGYKGVASMYSRWDTVLMVLFVVALMGIMGAQNLLEGPLFEVWQPTYEHDADGKSGLSGLLSGFVGALVGGCCAFIAMRASRRAAARRVNRELEAGDAASAASADTGADTDE